MNVIDWESEFDILNREAALQMYYDETNNIRHFAYVQQNSLPTLRQNAKRFTAREKENLGLLRALIDRSDDFSTGLLHAVLLWDVSMTNDEFLHGRRAPTFLG